MTKKEIKKRIEEREEISRQENVKFDSLEFEIYRIKRDSSAKIQQIEAEMASLRDRIISRGGGILELKEQLKSNKKDK